MYLYPPNRLFFLVLTCNELDPFGVCFYVSVTAHTRVQGGIPAFADLRAHLSDSIGKGSSLSQHEDCAGTL